MKNITKNIIATIMIMVMVLTGVTPTMTAEAKSTKISITVTNKATGKKIGKKLSLKVDQKVQLTVKYGKKNITKKAKYKVSNKNVTVSKKGKIIAKKTGTSTVTVTYKKKTKKIKITVKAIVKTQSTTEEKQPTEKKTAEDVRKDCESNTDLHPECNHIWDTLEFHTDTPIKFYENFFDLYQEHLFLAEIHCTKCGCTAITTSVPLTEALKYTNDELTGTIIYYLDTCKAADVPKHKCKYVQVFSPLGDPGDWEDGGWSYAQRCSVCHQYKE